MDTAVVAKQLKIDGTPVHHETFKRASICERNFRADWCGALARAAWTGFLDAYTHVGTLHPRMQDLPVSVAALLVAEACNVGLTPVTNPNEAALTRDRLSHVDQNYLRADTHAEANARLITAQAGIGVAQVWGGGLLASVDGLRFVVPVQTINAAPSPRYFGLKRGVTWLNAVNDQVAGIGAVVVPGTMRDSLHILDTLLNLDGGPRPDTVATDTASYSDIVFGLFRMLGYRFSRASPTCPISGSGAPPRPVTRAAIMGRSTRSPATGSTSPKSWRTGRTCCGWPALW